MTPSQLPIMFGLVLEDADAEERARMLGTLPPPIRLLLQHHRRVAVQALRAPPARCHDRRGAGLDLGVARGAARVPLAGERRLAEGGPGGVEPAVGQGARHREGGVDGIRRRDRRRRPEQPGRGCRVAHPQREPASAGSA